MEPNLSELLKRIENLEAEVKNLKHQTFHQQAAANDAFFKRKKNKPAAKPDAADGLDTTIRRSEFWFNKIGIALILLSLAYFMQYSIEQGWLVPEVRMLFGLILSAALLYGGFRFILSRRHFALVLMGGGIAGFYISIFGAFYLYQLIPQSAAFIFMIIITLYAFLISVRINESVLSVIATLGGLATPFLIASDAGSAWSLILYTTVVSAGAASIYWFRGWMLLALIYIIGGLTVFFSMAWVFDAIPDAAGYTSVFIAMALFWAVPLCYDVFKAGSSAIQQSVLTGLLLLVPFASFLLVEAVVSVEKTPLGWTALGFSLLMLAVWLALYLSGVNSKHTDLGLGVGFLLLINTSCFLLLETDWIFLAVVAQVFLLNSFSKRTSPGLLRFVNLFFTLVGAVWLANRLGNSGIPEYGMMTLPALVNLTAILALHLLSVRSEGKNEQTLFAIAAHAASFSWLYVELMAFGHGTILTYTGWMVYTLTVLVVSIRYRHLRQLIMGNVLLLIVFLRLVLFDFGTMEILHRILYFLGFGVLFLAASFYTQNLLRKKEETGR